MREKPTKTFMYIYVWCMCSYTYYSNTNVYYIDIFIMAHMWRPHDR